MKMQAKTGKIDQEVKPGSLLGARIEIAGNGGVIVNWNHAPEKSTKDTPYNYVEHRPDSFGSIEDACHAIVQAAGGNSEIAEYEEDKKSEKAA